MYIVNIANTIKMMSVNELRDFIFENYSKQIGFTKEISYCSMKHLKKDLQLLATKLTEIIKPVPSNYKEYHISYLKRISAKSAKQ